LIWLFFFYWENDRGSKAKKNGSIKILNGSKAKKSGSINEESGSILIHTGSIAR
jgi:hypothetical protein